jgi:O-antigen/teichoic acid export membrane protein
MGSKKKNDLINKLNKITKSQFFLNVGIVLTGTAGAQAITMLFAPIITRQYGPEAFGLLGTFLAILLIFTPIAALTYPTAIILPKHDKDAKALGWLSFYIAFSMSICVAIVILFSGNWLISLVGSEAIAEYTMLIPLAMFFATILEIAKQWLIRKKQFKITAKVALYQAFIVNSTKAGLGLINPIALNLIAVAVVGNFFHAVMLWAGIREAQIQDKTRQENICRPSKTDLEQVAKNYKEFPAYRAPQKFINAISQSLPILMLASFFGPAAAGFYSLAKTVLGMPAILIGKSFGEVFYPRISEAAHNQEDLRRLIIKATITLAALGFIPFSILIAFGPLLFGFVFGADWVYAGEYARWIALWSYFGFINVPSVISMPVLVLQAQLLIFDIIGIAGRLASILIGFYYFESAIFSIALFSMFGALWNISLIIFVVLMSKGRLKKLPFPN